MLAQLVVHFHVEGFCKSGGKLAAYICCMVSTIDLSLTSQSIVNLFFFGFWSLNTCSSLALL